MCEGHRHSWRGDYSLVKLGKTNPGWHQNIVKVISNSLKMSQKLLNSAPKCRGSCGANVIDVMQDVMAL